FAMNCQPSRIAKRPRKRASGKRPQKRYKKYLDYPSGIITTKGEWATSASHRATFVAASDLDRAAQAINSIVTKYANSLTTKEIVHKPYEDSIRRHLSKIKDIVAVCILGDEDNDSLIRVFSVVSEFDS